MGDRSTQRAKEMENANSLVVAAALYVIALGRCDCVRVHERRSGEHKRRDRALCASATVNVVAARASH